ncbi:LptA/OstA family protein [Lentisphaera profundi]|uniref:LptA/OstA family protein n=1 Tax=Lentisphaera profundi TaxID=1658616 RepID=A0ABY7VQR6_9BACT|nr:LptA/OstA family protein [Lentisphaera profundi]WDE96037.1 LptA/OstA family protein [Lentisphaera profundi]
MIKLLFLLLFGLTAFAEVDATKASITEKPVNKETEEVIITSDTLDFFNQEQKRMAIFEHNVVVIRGKMTITAKKMTAYFNSKNEIHLIIAEGDVVITEEDNKSTSQKVAYSPKEKKIILIRKPVIYMNENKIEARRITIYQESGDIFFDEPIMHTLVKNEQIK